MSPSPHHRAPLTRTDALRLRLEECLRGDAAGEGEWSYGGLAALGAGDVGPGADPLGFSSVARSFALSAAQEGNGRSSADSALRRLILAWDLPETPGRSS